MANNKNHKDNLTPIKKGEKLNPNGRPVGTKNRATIARMILDAAVNFPKETGEKIKLLFPDFNTKTNVEMAAMTMQAAKAITDQDTNAIKFLLDSAYGPMTQKTETDLNVNGNMWAKIQNSLDD